MAEAAKRLPVVGAAGRPAGKARAAAAEPAWIRAGRVVAGLGFVAAVPVILGVPAGMRLFWTVTIAVLPLVFVLGGYHAWRRICPLAAVGQLGRLVGRPGTKKVGPWLAANYLLVQGGVLFVGLWARLVGTNGTPWALAAFLGVIAAAAAVTSLVYGGKAWCNYFCPVGVVEKLYTEPSGAARGAALETEGNSQCASCTACKKHCPDIDLEQGYWKEAGEAPRRWVYFAWPGVVVAFYVYYWACSGGWDYYFSGAWTREPEQWRLALDPGFSFAPAVPRLAASALTLAAGGLASFALFAGIERGLRGAGRLEAARARHVTLVVAGCTAFLGFYLFAGQPTLAQAPWWLKRGIEALLAGAAIAMLVRRLPRSEAAFVNDKAARVLRKKWEWDDAAPASAEGALAVHAERQKARAARLAAYKDTIRELVADGVVARGELALLDALRRRLDVSDKEHAKVVSELGAEEKQLFDPAYRGSVEARLSREQYRRDLERLVIYAAREGVAPDAEALERLREEFGVARGEHEAALAELRGAGGPLAGRAAEEAAAITTLRRAARRARALAAGGGGAGGAGGSHSVALFDALCAWRARQHRELYAALAALVDGAPAIPDEPPADEAADAAALYACARDDSPYLRAAAAWLLSRQDDEPARAAVRAAAGDESALVREAAVRALGARGRLTHDLVQRALDDRDARVKRAVLRAAGPAGATPPGATADAAALAQTTQGLGLADPGVFATLDRRATMDHLSTLEKLMFLAEVPLFAGLPPDDLEDIAGIAGDRAFPAGTTLCREGERGDEVFVIVAGRVRASVGDGGVGTTKTLGDSGPGQCLGEMAALDAGPRTATLTAIADTRALVLDGRSFRELLAERPALATSVLSVVTARLRALIADKAGKETP